MARDRQQEEDDTLTAANERGQSPGRREDTSPERCCDAQRAATNELERLASDANERDEGLPQQSGETEGMN